MLKVAIIGSSGFIGRNLIQRLKSETEVELFLFGKSEVSKNGNEFPYKKIDFFNKADLEQNFSNIDVVYYLASETIPASSWHNPLIEVEKNLIPFINLLEVISKLDVKKIAFISSAGTVYGPTSGKVTEDSDKRPFSPYGIMKLTMESFLNYYKAKCGLEYDVYRVSNVYGEGQNIGKGLGIINTFLEKIIEVNQVDIYGDGSNTRNYIYVKDVAELLTLSVRNTTESGVYNISSNTTVSINALVKVIKKIVSEDFTVKYLEGRQSDTSFIDLDNSRIIGRFPSFKFTSLEQGIKETYLALKQAKSKNL